MSTPIYGEQELVCTGFTVQHDKTENGVARFTLTFLDAAADSSPTTSHDSKSAAIAAADAGVDASLKDFALTLTGVPGYVREAAQTILTDIGQTLENTFPFVSDGLDLMSGTASLVQGGLSLVGQGQRYFQGGLDLPLVFSSLAGGLGTFGGKLANISNVGNQVAGLVRLLSPASGSWGDAYTTQRQLWDYGQSLPTVPQLTQNRQVQANNQTALIDLVQRTSLFEAARCVPFMELENHNQALTIREELTERLDQVAEKTSSDAVFQAVEGMRRVVVADINSRAPSLADLASYTPTVTSPALVVSYELYETPHRASEIVSRNHIAHPGRLTGGNPLEVLRR